MSLFRTIGTKVKGLLGDEQFFDRLARAQAFANGDHMGAAQIGAMLRRAAKDRADRSHAIAGPPTNVSGDASPVPANVGLDGGASGQGALFPSRPAFAATDWMIDGLPGLFDGPDPQWGRRHPGQTGISGFGLPHALHPVRR